MKRLTIEQARKEGYTVDTHCYPYFAYKGARFAPVGDTRECYTEMETELLAALGAAIATYQFASMTGYEREVCAKVMAAAEAAFDKYSQER